MLYEVIWTKRAGAGPGSFSNGIDGHLMSKVERIAADRWEIQLRKGTLDLAVLASLWPGPAYGLEILRTLERGASLVVPEGTIYPLLNRLKGEGLLRSEWKESDAGHPRKYYALTRSGRLRVQEMGRIWALFSASLNELLTPVGADSEG